MKSFRAVGLTFLAAAALVGPACDDSPSGNDTGS